MVQVYFPRAIGVLEDIRFGDNRTDFAFEIEGSEIVEINDHEMCRYTGTHSYMVEGAEQTQPFVAYSTQASNGGYVYWIVIEGTDVKTSGEDADFIAYTFRETEKIE